MNAIISSGLNSIQQSQQAMQQSAHAIAAQASPSPTAPSMHANPLPAEQGVGSAVASSTNLEGSSRLSAAQADPVNELLAIRQQEHLFNAAAGVVKVGADAVGSLIDDYS